MCAVEPAAPRFRRLLPTGATGETLSADEALAGCRPEGEGVRLALNMIASVDGRIAVGGRSAPLGGPADRALFHSLRARVDAVLVGAGTLRSERYGPLIRDERTRSRRVQQGLSPQPLALIVSRHLELDPAIPLLADPETRAVVLTTSAGDLPPCAAQVDYVRTATLAAGLDAVRARWGVRLVLCEGGPTLNGTLAAEDLIDELFLAVSPLLVGDTHDGRAVLMGGAPRTPLALTLAMLLAHEDELYAHYVRRSDSGGRD